MKQKLLISLVLSAVAQMAVPLHAATPAASATTAPAAQAPFQRSAFALKQQKFVLKNGLTLIVHEDHSVPVVAVNLWYHVGSRNEQRGKTGFAHLFEHFFFNGSENYPHGFREAMDDLGANNRNGTTNGDRTNFYEDVPVSALERTLYLESDRMGYLGNYISKEMLERERGVVQNEKRQGENQPYGRVWDEISAQMYPYSHPYSWSTIGSMDDLNAASLDDIKQWYRTYYGPNNAVIALAGDITPERALALVTQYFGAIPPGPPLPRTQSWIPRLDSNIRSEMEDRVPQARIYRSYHAPAFGDPSIPALSLFADVLAGSKSARLDRRLVYEKGLATSVSAGVADNELAGAFQIVVTVKPGVAPADAEREMDQVLQQLLKDGPTMDELSRAKTRGFAAVARANERLGRRANLLAENATFGATPEAYLDQLEAAARVTPEQVRRSGAAWLNANSHTMTVKPFAQLSAEKSTLDRKLLPALGTPPDVAFPAIERAQLKNGVKVVLLQRHTAPIVNVTLALDAGSASDSAAKAGAASLAMDLLDKGTRTRNAFQLSDALESLGANLSSSSLADLSLLRLQSTAGNLAPSLALMADAALRPAFDESSFAQQKQRRLAQIGQEKAQPSSLAMRIVPAILYGKEHAYGRPVSGYADSVQGLTRTDMAQWHATWFKPGSATIVVSGDTTLAQLMPALEASFGSWQGGSAPAKAVAAPGRTAGKRVFLIDKPDAPQSTIVAAHLSQVQGQPEDLAAEPLMQNFGGMATSRLNRNLRLDKHWSYGTSGQLTNPRGQRAFLVLAPVQTDKTREAMQEVAKEIRGVAGERPVQGEEFDSIMRNMHSRLAGRFETLAALDSAALTSLNLGLPDAYWSNYSTRMRQLDAAQLARAGGKFVQPDELVWVVVGDLRKIEAGVRELGWGEVMVLDADGMPGAK
ncbi:M16 family metallopeptidase [Janthinobacterium violaceinigrum]|uniref:Insulinase family protein n=1 Tax=Janthinobacterium violaceinigrum TaxID=2654252 RepID=A0A6I1I5Q5_9BURK|nr:pitrilysin family protein [Janthinobacterium violaceinigrum]KAB8065320.1 insulinase family protein [Janthinobacterium violaceinigrum]